MIFNTHEHDYFIMVSSIRRQTNYDKKDFDPTEDQLIKNINR